MDDLRARISSSSRTSAFFSKGTHVRFKKRNEQ